VAGIVSKGRRDGAPKRTREHQIADMSANYVESIVLKKGYVVEGFRHDYGYDLSFYTYHYPPGSTDGEYENDSIKIQLKATDGIQTRYQGKYVGCQVDQEHLNLWRGETMPVLLVVYDAQKAAAYWLHVQPYIKGLSDKQIASRTVLIPTANAVTEAAVEEWRQLKINRRKEIEAAEKSYANLNLI
jgi:hypothetical protein